jgi:hypothetical protein
MAQTLWKNMLVMNIQICTKKGHCFCCRWLQNPEEENMGQRKGKLSSLFKSHTFLAANGLTTNQILYNMPFWKIWLFMLQRVTNLYLLLEIHGCNVWFCGNVGMYSFHLVAKR